MNELIVLSKIWVDEAISYGIVANTKQDFVGKDIYVAYNRKNKIVGYLMCSYFEENKQRPTIPLGSRVCYVDEIYVLKNYRSKGIGSLLFYKMNADIKNKCDYIEVCTSTKNHKKIMHFYEEVLGLNFWSAMFFKKI